VLVLCALPVNGVLADDPLSLAAQCAAYWLGRNDVARRSALLDEDANDPVRADAYRAAAVRLNGGDAVAIDAFIRQERTAMDSMVRAAIVGDPTSVALQDRLLRTCDEYAATQAETRDLR